MKCPWTIEFWESEDLNGFDAVDADGDYFPNSGEIVGEDWCF